MSAKLLDLKGIGPATARQLTEAGFSSVVSIAEADPGDLTALSGIGSLRAASLQAEARWLLGDDPATAPTEAPAKAKKKAKKGPKKGRKKRAKKLRKEAKQLRKQALALTKRAKSTKSKKKRKQRLRKASELEAAANTALRKAKKLDGK